jgi:hypothetical protein
MSFRDSNTPNAAHRLDPFPTGGRESSTLEIPVSQLISEVYATADGDRRGQLLAQIVGRCYEKAALAERIRLLEHLLKPLGVLSLFSVANGVFAKILHRSLGRPWTFSLDDARLIHTRDVIALVDRFQQIHVDAVDDLLRMLASLPVVAGSCAASLLGQSQRVGPVLAAPPTLCQAPRLEAYATNEFGKSA